MHVVLLEPEIPPNTGSVARLCAAAGAFLHLIEPLGFGMDDRRLARAGMDYWKQVRWRRWPGWTEFREEHPVGGSLWYVESGGPRHYAQARYGPGDYLVFGRETAGLPPGLVRENPGRWLRIPMLSSRARSLNLAASVAIVLYEALRQQGFPGESGPGAPGRDRRG